MARTLAMASGRRRSNAAARASHPQPQKVELGKVSAVFFNTDGVLCNSEEASRMAAVDVFAEMGVSVSLLEQRWICFKGKLKHDVAIEMVNFIFI